MAELGTWTDGRARSTITEFVHQVTDPGGSAFVPPEERVAVFDNDGTLWCEKPLPIQLDFTLRRLAMMASHDEALQHQQPFQAAYEHDMHWLGAAVVKHYHGDNGDMQLLMGAVTRAFEAVTVEDYAALVRDFFSEAAHPSLARPYRSCGYAPMVELLGYLSAHDFTCYIASGGDRDFMRPIADDLYGIPPERVVGSALGLTYDSEGGSTSLIYKAAMDFFDDGPEKPVRIWSRIGRRPILACGNSNGDVPMLDFAGAVDRPSLRLLLLHDDASREFAYVAGAEQALDRAKEQAWQIISMKDDWRTVFADQ